MTLIKYKEINFTTARLERIRRVAVIIEDYGRRGFPVLSLRQVYYILVTKNVIANEERSYDQLGDDLRDGRLAGLISWEAIEDRNKGLKGHQYWESPADLVTQARDGYRLDKWADQPVRPEVWVEKRALESVVGEMAGKLDVDFFAVGGYNSASEMWRGGRRMAGRIQRGQRPVVLYLGDHDPSGMDMVRDTQERLALFAGVPIQVIRVALNMDQIERYRPPPNPAKVRDPRFAEYLSKYGDESWEVDALAPEVLQDLIRSAVLAFRDAGRWEVALELENVDRARLTELVEEHL